MMKINNDINKDKSAADFFKDEKIITGWNLGDTLDSHEKGVSKETAWGNPKANQVLFNGVKEAGFDLVRIPVTWMGHFASKPDYIIEEKFLKRIEEVIGFAHNAGLKVIINMHHDGITSKDEKVEGWHSVTKACKSSQDCEKITHQFAQLWKQIAEYFKDYGNWLMFESMNEIHDGNWGYNSKEELEIDDVLKPQIEILNMWNQVFTDTVRSTEGNNKYRYLVLPGYCTVPQHTAAPYFILPKDSTQGKQIVSFHYYDPYEFGIEGSQHIWGSKKDKKQVDEDFSPFKKRFIDNSVPVIIGESGAVKQFYPDDSAKEDKAHQCRLDYIKHVYSKAREYGLVPVYWDNGATAASEDDEKFGLINRKTGKPNSSESEAVIKAMMNN
ncbi:MAG: glycoside hydrolase family 5 protein [Treponema sp.]|nr:glycoside hydrolase family 5 protein [Treponema sp.]